MTERGAHGFRSLHERIGDAGPGRENLGIPVFVWIVFNADYGEFGVFQLQSLETWEFRAARRAPGSPEVQEDGFALRRL